MKIRENNEEAMIGSPLSLSLADVARLAGVKRPVASMWRKRGLAGRPFPAADAQGRFAAEEIADWLEATGRGNNPEARADLAIQAAASAWLPAQDREALLALLAARAVLDEPLTSYGLDDLVDEIDALDPDDDFLLSEVEALAAASFPSRAAQADAIAEAAWNPRAAYDRLLEAQPGAGRDERLHPDLLELLAGLCRALLRPGGELVDVQGECCDVVIEACAQEDLPTPTIRVPLHGSNRDALRRYRVHGTAIARCGLREDWVSSPGSLTLVRVSDRAGFALIDEARLQLAKGSAIVVVGPAWLLTDALAPDGEASRDEFIRQARPQPAVLQAAVRLPAGLTRGGSRSHLALWLLGPASQRLPIWVGDISGAGFERATRQALLDDLVSVARAPGHHAFTMVQAANRSAIAARGGSLVSIGGVRQSAAMVPAADDAARLAELRRALAAPMPEAFGYEPIGLGDGAPRRLTLGDALDSRQIRVLPGTRLPGLPTGATPLWTSDAVAQGRSASVDLLSLAQQRPDARLTEPRDVVFTTAGKPAAVLDPAGGAAVAYPARVLRVTGGRLCPAAIVDAINAVPAGNAKWRTWLVPESQIDLDLANEILESLQGWEAQLRQRQALLDELRMIITRSVLSGAIQLPHPHEQKGR